MGLLSLREATQNLRLEHPVASSICSRTHCATVSKQAMYCWASLVRKAVRSSLMSHCCANHQVVDDAASHPPIPTVVPSAMLPRLIGRAEEAGGPGAW